MFEFLFVIALFTQTQNKIPGNQLDIEIVTKKTETYSILTKTEPISWTVEGPTYLRVYTRIPWPNDVKGSVSYKIILQKNEVEEKMVTLESEVSKVTKDKLGRPLSKWRSFYIEVPEGKNTYKIIYWSSPKDTILLKFAYESPKSWQDISATDYESIIEAIEEERIIKYYELKKDGELTLAINGPIRLQTISRLNFDEKMMGEQNYAIIISEKGKDIKKTELKCYKSEIIQYKDRKEFVPSNASSIFINLSEGRHILKFNLSGTMAPSAALRFLVEQK